MEITLSFVAISRVLKQEITWPLHLSLRFSWTNKARTSVFFRPFRFTCNLPQKLLPQKLFHLVWGGHIDWCLLWPVSPPPVRQGGATFNKNDESEWRPHARGMSNQYSLHTATPVSSSQGCRKPVWWSVQVNILEARADSGFCGVLLKLGQVCRVCKGTGSQSVVVCGFFSWRGELTVGFIGSC